MYIRNIVIGIVLIQLLGSFVFLSLQHYNHSVVLKKTIDKKKYDTSYLVNNTFKTITETYTDYADKILSDQKVIDAFYNNNREELLRLVSPVYKNLKKSNPFLYVMHFHTVDTHSYLRVHKPHKYGDDLSTLRPIIVETNKSQKQQTGLEIGKYGIYYRITFPIFKDEKHIGAFEYGIDIKHIISIISQFNMYHPSLLLNNESISPIYKYDNKANDYLKQFSEGYSLLKCEDNRKAKFSTANLLDERIIDQADYIKDFDNKKYLIFKGFDFIDYKGTSIGNLVFIDQMDYYLKTISIVRWISILSILLLVTIIVLLIYKLISFYITSLIENEKQLTTTNKTLNNVLNGANLGYWDWYVNTHEHYVNDRWLDMLGLTRDDIKNTDEDWKDRINLEDKERILKTINNAIKDSSTYSVEFRMKHKDGHYVWIEGSGAVIEYDDDKNPIRLCGTHQDISDRKNLQENLEKLVITDSLTQLYNRYHFNQVFDTEVKRAKREKQSITFLMIDIDNFKKYNDLYGHQQGDEALRKISLTMKKDLKRPGDYIFRLGGEEFGIIFTDLTLGESLKYAENVSNNVESLAIVHQGNIPYKVCTISIGLCHTDFSHKNLTIDEIYKKADEALYKAKDNSKNKVVNL